LLYTLAAATCWGIWGVLAKGPSRALSGWMVQILFTFALVPSAIVAACSPQVCRGSDKPRGLFGGFVSGLLAAAGNIAFYLALEHGADTQSPFRSPTYIPSSPSPSLGCGFASG
jgi:uncharacterized membrane protein